MTDESRRPPAETTRLSHAAIHDVLLARGVAADVADDYAERVVRIERIERELDDGLDRTTLGIMYALDDYDGLAAARDRLVEFERELLRARVNRLAVVTCLPDVATPDGRADRTVALRDVQFVRGLFSYAHVCIDSGRWREYGLPPIRHTPRE